MTVASQAMQFPRVKAPLKTLLTDGKTYLVHRGVAWTGAGVMVATFVANGREAAQEVAVTRVMPRTVVDVSHGYEEKTLSVVNKRKTLKNRASRHNFTIPYPYVLVAIAKQP